ncbi:MAG: hypothetical protein ACK502_07380 [Alphaproteobacteria bacterium]
MQDNNTSQPIEILRKRFERALSPQMPEMGNSFKKAYDKKSTRWILQDDANKGLYKKPETGDTVAAIQAYSTQQLPSLQKKAETALNALITKHGEERITQFVTDLLEECKLSKLKLSHNVQFANRNADESEDTERKISAILASQELRCPRMVSRATEDKSIEISGHAEDDFNFVHMGTVAKGTHPHFHGFVLSNPPKELLDRSLYHFDVSTIGDTTERIYTFTANHAETAFLAASIIRAEELGDLDIENATYNRINEVLCPLKVSISGATLFRGGKETAMPAPAATDTVARGREKKPNNGIV